MQLKKAKHFDMRLHIPTEAFGDFFAALNQLPYFKGVSFEVDPIYVEDKEPDDKAASQPAAKPILAATEKFVPKRSEVPDKSAKVNRSHLSGEERAKARQETRDSAAALFEEIWPRLHTSGSWLIMRDEVFEAGKKLRMTHDQVNRALQWLLDNNWLTVRDRGLYYVGPESPQYKAMDSETAPEMSKAAD